MLANIIIGNILYYIAYIFGSFSFFATGWLYLDSFFAEKKRKIYLTRGLGFMALSISNIYFSAGLDYQLLNLISKTALLMSLIVIFMSFIFEKNLKKPRLESYQFILPANIPLFIKSIIDPQIFLISVITSFVILFKIVRSRDKQLKLLFMAFFFYSLSALVNIFLNTSGIRNIFWLETLKPFNTIWYVHLVLYLISVSFLGFWAFGYIRFRAGPQIFISLIASTLVIFSLTAALFNLVLVKNIEKDALLNLEKNAKLVKYNLENLQLQTLSITESISFDTGIKTSLESKDRNDLYQKATEYISSKKLSYIIFTDKEGRVMLRTRDSEIFGDDLSNEDVVASSVNGQKLSVIKKDEGIFFPSLSIKSAAPIFNDEKNIIGVVIAGFELDNSFVDGVKEVTGLDTNIFAEDIRIASTFSSENGKLLLIGTKETNDEIVEKVIGKKESFSGKNTFGNIPYYSYYLPLVSYEDRVIGMIAVSRSQLEVVNTIKENIRITFTGSVILMIFSVIPSFLLARFMEKNLNA